MILSEGYLSRKEFQFVRVSIGKAADGFQFSSGAYLSDEIFYASLLYASARQEVVSHVILLSVAEYHAIFDKLIQMLARLCLVFQFRVTVYLKGS